MILSMTKDWNSQSSSVLNQNPPYLAGFQWIIHLMDRSMLEAAGTVETAQLAFLQIAQLVHAGRGYI